MIRQPAVFLALAAWCCFTAAETFADDQGSAHSPASQMPISWKGTENLGEVDFETSCNDDNTQELVNVDLRHLHNFEYELALRNVQAAQEIESSSAFAYWGEAMSELQILHFFMNYESASEIYKRMDRLANLDSVSSKEHAKMRLERLLGVGKDHFIIVGEDNFAEEWPERFRSTSMPLELSKGQLKGLRELNIMGGGQPSEKHLRNIIERSENPVVVLDFRQEPHSYVAGIPITWFRPYVSDRELGTEKMMSLEEEFIDLLESTLLIQVDSVKWTGGQDYEVLSSEFIGNDTVLSNAEMVEKSGARYIRYHVPVVPSDRQVTEFEAFVEEVSEQDLTLYFLCWDGTGRSTEFMVMYDIIKNGGEVSLQTIADRHAAMGGINVLNLPPQSSPNYQRSALRRDFIIDYYQKRSETE